jgi:CheY-like chemotaxis protein
VREVGHQRQSRSAGQTYDDDRSRSEHPILVVEPDREEGAKLAVLLRRAGYDSIVVDTVPSGLRVVREEATSLVITAARVDGYNGLQLVAMSPRPIPAIVLAASADPFLELEARRLGAEILVKPAGAALLALVEKKLVSATHVGPVELRRWARKRVIGELHGLADAVRVRVVDVSYGGVRFEVDESSQPIGESCRLALPAVDLDLVVNVAWKRLTGSRWAYGAVVAEAQRPGWRRLVDAIA